MIAGFSRLLDPKASRTWKKQAAAIMRASMGYRRPLAGPLIVTISAVWEHPKATWKKDAPLSWAWAPIDRGDADNIAKAVLDAGNGILWQDDALIVSLHVLKLRCPQGERAHVKITVDREPPVER